MTRLPYPTGTVPIGSPRRDPTAARALGRASKRSAPAVPVPELRTRLCRAVAAEDGHGALLLACHIRRAEG